MGERWNRALAAVAIALASANPLWAQQPRLTADQAIALFSAAGFPLGADKHPLDRCGQSANPKVTFVDINGDRRPEALFIDEGACYKPDGRWYAIATQTADGRWRRIAEGSGTIAATGTAFRGWFVLAVTVVLSIAVASVSYALVEEPVRREFHRRTRAKRGDSGTVARPSATSPTTAAN